MDINKVVEGLKIDTEKVYEALPAIAYIMDKSEIIDLFPTDRAPNNSDAVKIIARLVSRMKDYEKEVDEVLEILFGVKVNSASERIKLITEIVKDKDVTSFF